MMCSVVSADLFPANDNRTLQIQCTFYLWYLPHLSNDEGESVYY